MSDRLQGLLDSAPKAIIHLRAQNIRKKLGLILGSGASNGLGYPGWEALVERIARHRLVKAEGIWNESKKAGNEASPITRSLASITQMMFAQFREGWIKRKRVTRPLTILEERKIESEWIDVVHNELYRDVKSSERKSLIERHPYLTSFLSIIKNSPLTVNYNFDDTLEKLLIYNRTDLEASRTRGYEVIDRPDAQFQKDAGVIYHPNGYLPKNIKDGTSAQIVFSDDAFQDQLISAATGRYLHLSNHLSSRTCLLIGLSLEDTTLQSMLRQNAVGSPGNVHYIVHYQRRDAPISEELRQVIFRANFDSFRLFTLFLDDEGIADLAALISMEPEKFEMDFQASQRKFTYYLVGSVGSGKSTATSNFRNVETYDEWIDERREKLAVPENQVSDDEIGRLDDWIVEQFKKKNFAATHKLEGIHIIDRCPLDPLTFGQPEKRASKAQTLIREITYNGKVKVEPGHIIHLDCSLDDVKIRNSLKHKYWPDSDYQELLERIKEIYGPLRRRSVICTRGRTAAGVAREIAEVIFLHEYRAVDIALELGKYARSGAADVLA